MVSSLSVVILAYNEEANVSKSIQHVFSVLKKLNLKDYEILLINDGSKDKTGEIAESLVKKTPHLRVITNNPNRGYGGALKTGLYAATKEFVVITHADNQFDFSEVTKLMTKQSENDADLVCGIRVGGGVDPLHRRFLRWLWNTLVRAIFGYLATDIDSGFKLYRRSVLKNLYTPSERGAMIDTQILANLRTRDYRIEELPVTHLPRTAGKASGSDLRVMIQSVIDIFTFWWQLKREILVERGLAVFPWEVVLIAVILIAGAFARVYNISDYMTFLGDEGRDARVMRDIVTLKHLPLIGPGTSIGSMYLGPLYYYLTAPSLLLFNFSPVGPALFVAFIGLLTIALLWWVGRQWYGRLSALFAASLYALSPTVIIYSRSSWNPNIMPFFALLSVYGIWKVWRYGYWRWFTISMLSFAFVLNSHYLGLLLTPVLFSFWFLAVRSKKSPLHEVKRSSVTGIVLFLLLLTPLVFFDLRHGGQNLEALKLFLTERQTTVNFKAYKALPLLWPLWQQIVTSLITAKDVLAGQIVAILIPVGLFLAFLKKLNRKDLLFAVFWLAVGLVGLGLYKQHIYDHYFGFLYPTVFLLLGFAFKSLIYNPLLRPLAVIGFLVLLVINIQNNPLRFSPNSQLSRTSEVARDINRLSGGKPFNLALIANSNYDESYRYFLELAKAPIYTIHDQLSDQLFVICEKNPCEPVGHPLWEVAAFGWAKIDQVWDYPWGVKVYRLVHTLK